LGPFSIEPFHLETGKGRTVMFENQYNEEMEAEVRRLEAKKRAADAGHPEWDNACAVCGARIAGTETDRCRSCI
jgi:hypothetical protein